MDLNHRLDRLQRRAQDLSSQSASLQQDSARLRAHSTELLTRLAILTGHHAPAAAAERGAARRNRKNRSADGNDVDPQQS